MDSLAESLVLYQWLKEVCSHKISERPLDALGVVSTTEKHNTVREHLHYMIQGSPHKHATCCTKDEQ